ncbi:hypothetical protein FSP39_013676 [Pinctada imbricata]|uniref:VWFA domain-containing protein n=1 Tax=Pinctada imbricata TaxID=66713 RepID=A0AA88YR60_PINIB|nr:hypothetical protein FSP39_013676 [Pinctada imbricata]
MGMFTTEGCFIFMAFLQIFYQRGACQCSDGKIVESTAGYSPGSLFFRPYYFSITCFKQLLLLMLSLVFTNTACTNPKADIAFLLDSSGSISTLNFRLMLSFVSLLISKYDLGDPSLQTSVVSFSTNAIVHFDLNDFTSTYDALSFISGISPMQQNTYTDRGIRIIREQVFNSSLGDREENPNILVIFTDGVSTEPNRTLNEINKIKENGVKVIAIGIQGFDEKEINLLASNDRYALKIEKFSDLQKLQNVLQELICLATEESVKLTTQTSTKLTSTSVEKGELTSTSLMSTTTLETISMKTTTDMSTQISTLPETDLITTTPVDEKSSSYGASTTEVTTSFEISSANIDTTTERSSSDSTEAVSEILSSTENIQTLSVPTDGDTIKSTSESTTEYVSETTKFSSDIPTYSTTIFYTTEAEGLTETQTSRDMQSSTSTSATSNKMVSSDSTETSPIPASSTEQNDHRKSTKSTQDLTSSVGEFSPTTETLTSTAADSTTTEDLTTFGESGSTVDTTNYETTTTSQDLTSDSTTEQSTFHTEGVTSTVYSDKMTIPFSSSQQDLAIYTTVSDSSTDVSTTEITVEHFSSFSSVSTLPSLSETTTLKEEISSGSFSSNSTVISEIPMTTDSQNIQSSGTSTDSTLFETTTKAKTIIESTTEIITETTPSSTFASTHPTSMLHTTSTETKGLTETQTSHYAQTYLPIISDGTTDSHTPPPTIEVSQGLGSSSVQVVTTSPTEMTTNKKHVSTDNDQTSKSSTSDSIIGITTLPTINPTTTRDSTSEGLDNVIGTTVQFSTSTSNSVQETDALSVETTKMTTTSQKDTSLTGSISNSQPSTTTSGLSSTSTHSVMSMTSSLGTEKSTNSPTQSSISTPVSTKSSFQTSSTTNTFQTGDGAQTKNISVSHTTENVAIRATPSEDGGGLSLVAIWGITVTGITLVLGISSCCGCCYLIGGYRRKKRKRKRKKRYEKQDWHRLFDDFGSTLSINFRNGHFPTRMDSKLSHSFNSKRNRSGYLNDMYPYEDLNV